jgi:L-alanine-DL-glutamate epimerase-like enolase superfamily enzyme
MATSTSERVQKHRDALRAAGLRPVQIWVPDTRRAGFAEECRRQSRLLQGDAHEQETAEWLEATGDREGWE